MVTGTEPLPQAAGKDHSLLLLPSLIQLHSQETGSQAETCSAWVSEGSPHLGRVNPGEPLAHSETNPVLCSREPSTSLLSFVICKMGPNDDYPYGAAVRFKQDHIIRERVATPVFPKNGPRKVPEGCFTTHVPPAYRDGTRTPCPPGRKEPRGGGSEETTGHPSQRPCSRTSWGHLRSPPRAHSLEDVSRPRHSPESGAGKKL